MPCFPSSCLTSIAFRHSEDVQKTHDDGNNSISTNTPEHVGRPPVLCGYFITLTQQVAALEVKLQDSRSRADEAKRAAQAESVNVAAAHAEERRRLELATASAEEGTAGGRCYRITARNIRVCGTTGYSPRTSGIGDVQGR